MEASLKKIIDLLGSDNAEVQCAAAIVLGELKPTEKAATQALAKALASENVRVRLCALDAVSKIGGEEAVEPILPLLKAQGEVREKAIAALSAIGHAAVKKLKGYLSSKDRALKMAIIKIILNNWGKDSLQTLLQCLFDPDFEVVRFVCDAVRNQSNKMDDTQRAELFKATSQFLGLKKVKENKTATISAIRLLGYSKQSKAKSLLLKYASPKNDVSVRRHALVSLRNLEYQPIGNDDVINTMLSFCYEKDFQNIVSGALDVLKVVKISDKFASKFIKLLNCEHFLVRQFAIGVLGQFDSPEAAKALSALAQDKDPGIRQAATASLAKNPAAVTELVKRLNDAKTIEEAWEAAKILRGHSERLKPALIKSLTSTMFELIDKESDFYRPYYYLVSNLAPEPTYQALFQRGVRHMKAKKLHLAERCLQLVPDAPSSPPESKLYLAAVRLKLSPKSLAKVDRDRDVCLKQFGDLARKEGFDLLGHLKKIPILGAEELYYLGFHLAEEAEPLRKAGREILTYVSHRWPRTKMAKDARTKLQTESSLQPPASEIPDKVKKKVESMW